MVTSHRPGVNPKYLQILEFLSASRRRPRAADQHFVGFAQIAGQGSDNRPLPDKDGLPQINGLLNVAFADKFRD